MTQKTETLAEKSARLRALRLASKPLEKRQYNFYPVYGMQDELRFGKHKGETIKFVLNTDLPWIIWALETINFIITPEVEDELRFLEDPRRPELKRLLK